ncbi:MAG: glycosyltransferase [Anaerolineales bacterium]|nr:glycosyltransferase [Anaerolineales bacterium]
MELVLVPDDPFRAVQVPAWKRYWVPTPPSYWPSLPMRAQIEELASASRWDAVIAIQLHVAQYALGVKGARYVLDLDTSLSHQMLERYQSSRGAKQRTQAYISWKKAERYEAQISRQFNVCAVASPVEMTLARQLIDGSDCRVVLVANGVDCGYNQPALAPKVQGRLVYNGALTYSVNFDAMQYFLAEIYPLIKTKCAAASLMITGKNKGVDLNALALDDSVALTGYVEDIRMPVASASVCVAPIRQGSGTRLKLLEAMALGTPVVATRKAAEGLEVVDEEHLLLADTPQQFAVAVLRLFDDRALSAQLARNARMLVERCYNWDRISCEFGELVTTAAANARSTER